MNRLVRNEIIFYVLLGWLVIGCSAPPPSPTAAPIVAPSSIPTATAAITPTTTPTLVFKEYPNITPEFIPSPTPPAVLYTMQDTLREFPLRLGATWVYSSTEYTTIEGGGQITATFRVTDTVVAVETRNAMHAARVERTAELIQSTQDLSEIPHGETYFRNMQNPMARWLIVDGKNIYQQWELDWLSVVSAHLVYIFPLRQENRWYPFAEQRALFSPSRPGLMPGRRLVQRQGNYRVPAGSFEACFEIHEEYNRGDSVEWFCAGVGVVAEQSDLGGGPPFGFRSELVQFSHGK